MPYEEPGTFSILEALLVERELVEEKRGIGNQSIDWWDTLSKDAMVKIDIAINGKKESKLFIELVKAAAIQLAWAEDIYRDKNEKRR